MWLSPQFPADLVTLLKKSLMENYIFWVVMEEATEECCTRNVDFPALSPIIISIQSFCFELAKSGIAYTSY